ncbi:MAG: hypothetical protein RBT65_00060 [Methanolobus sp.]|nr:hypothetical protein [Methanolobus sp.]
MNTTHKIIAFVVIVLLLSLVVISGQSTKEELHYSDEELQALYDKYDITENDLKFARENYQIISMEQFLAEIK